MLELHYSKSNLLQAATWSVVCLYVGVLCIDVLIEDIHTFSVLQSRNIKPNKQHFGWYGSCYAFGKKTVKYQLKLSLLHFVYTAVVSMTDI